MARKGLKRQGSLYAVAAIFAVTAVAVVGPRLWTQTTACVETALSFTEGFNTLDFKDAPNCAVDGWTAAVHGPITLPGLGSKFSVAGADSMGGYVYASAAGDFTGDGYPDLIALDITGQASDPRVAPYSRLVLVRNQYVTDPDHPLVIDWTEVYDSFGTIYTGPCCITAGDYNGDGLLDFLFMRNSNDEFAYTNFLAKMYINTGTATNPNFSATSASNLDFTSAFKAAPIYCHWLANHMASVDYDKDGDVDVLIISQNKVYVLKQGGGTWRLGKFSVSELSYGGSAGRTGYTGLPGGSAIAAADFDGDTDIDIICGSVGTASYLVLYLNDGKNVFTKNTIAIPDATCRGVVAIMPADFTNDGRIDVFVATDSMYRRSLGLSADARIWFLRNETVNFSISWSFACLNGCTSPTPSPYDIDVSTMLDFDKDGDMDVIISDANHSGDYYLIENDLAGYFATYGQAVSLNLAASLLDPALHAITRVRITNLLQGVRGGDPTGLTVTLYFSNSGGRVWEFYRKFEGSDIANEDEFDWYEFKQFGADLRWKAVLTAPQDEVYDIYSQYIEDASYESPYIDEIEFEVTYIHRLEYSRASAAATVVDQEGTPTKLVIGASFIYPGDEGQLRAYDVTSVSIAAGTASQLQTITTSNLSSSTGRDMAVEGADILWDAGQLLDDRAYDSRVIYTAVRADGDLANPLVRTDFTAANVGTLAALIDDVQDENAELINFIRGYNRNWKLGDINRSTPVIVGPPVRDAAYMGDGYADFKTAYADRAKVIYVGANDGMLHCFDVLTGEELWGFIPYNLLPKLKEMYQVDPTDASARYFLPSQTGFVDATPAVADVQIDGAWKTVLVCGQGPGSGSVLAGGLNYYWALDVTDPTNPQPLWEITHTDASSGYRTMGETRSTPAIGKINDGGTARWVAFVGSGYDNDTSSPVAGTYFYTIRIDTGEVISALPVDADVDTSALSGAKEPYQYTNIAPAIVASPTAIDNTLDGFIDLVYVADLDGRVYRLNASVTDVSAWTLTKIYEDYLNYPIATKPAVWLNPYESTPTPPRIYFGTGGHDRNLGTYNPDTDEFAPLTFSFVSVVDRGTAPVTKDWVEWYIGDPALLGGLPAIKDTGDLGVGSKVWADPIIADMILYFSTLTGSIESANPCANLGEGGHLYARYVRQTSAIPVGGTAFRATEGTPPEYLQLQSKARQAVTVGEASYDETNRVNKREIYVQEYDSAIQQLVQPIGSLLRVKSWREVYRVIWD